MILGNSEAARPPAIAGWRRASRDETYRDEIFLTEGNEASSGVSLQEKVIKWH